jgi:hypothetical protein
MLAGQPFLGAFHISLQIKGHVQNLSHFSLGEKIPPPVFRRGYSSRKEKERTGGAPIRSACFSPFDQTAVVSRGSSSSLGFALKNSSSATCSTSSPAGVPSAFSNPLSSERCPRGACPCRLGKRAFRAISDAPDEGRIVTITDVATLLVHVCQTAIG